MEGFTREALESVNKDKLYELAKYYDLDVTWRTLKDDMIDTLLEHFNKTVKVEPDKEETVIEENVAPPMSVRVKRIYEQGE